MSFQKRTLFLGDLPIFCSELDLENLFVPFGDIYEIRLKVDKTTQRNLSYGFVKFVIPECAQKALEALDGQRLQGRAIKVRWASNGPNDDDSINSNRNSIQIQVSYVSRRKDLIVNENTLRTLFSCYGEVLDVSIKKSSVVKEDSGSQSGYGFVHFANTPTGAYGALAAVKAVQNVMVDRVTYDCHLSHRCCKEIPSLLKAQDYQDNQTATAAETVVREPEQIQEHQQQQHKTTFSSHMLKKRPESIVVVESQADGTAETREETSVSPPTLNHTLDLPFISVMDSAGIQHHSNSFKRYNEMQQEKPVPRPQRVHSNVQQHVRGAVFSGANLLSQSFACAQEPSYPTSPTNYSYPSFPAPTLYRSRANSMHPHVQQIQQIESYQMHYQSPGQTAPLCPLSLLTPEQYPLQYHQQQQLQVMEEYVRQQLICSGLYYPAPPQAQPMQIAPTLQQHDSAYKQMQQPSSPTSIAASVMDSQNFATRASQEMQQTPPLSPPLSPPPLFRTLSCVEIRQQSVFTGVCGGQPVFEWHMQQYTHTHLQQQQNYV